MEIDNIAPSNYHLFSSSYSYYAAIFYLGDIIANTNWLEIFPLVCADHKRPDS